MHLTCTRLGLHHTHFRNPHGTVLVHSSTRGIPRLPSVHSAVGDRGHGFYSRNIVRHCWTGSGIHDW
jgi:hypothetical protein